MPNGVREVAYSQSFGDGKERAPCHLLRQLSIKITGAQGVSSMKCYRSILPGLAAILLGLQPVAKAQQGVPDETDALGRHFVNRIGRKLHHRGDRKSTRLNSSH